MTDATTTPTDKAGEPVAWRYRSKSGTSGWMVTLDPNMGEWPNLIVQPLYTHPQPSLSVGLDREAVARIVRELSKGRCEVFAYHKAYAITERAALEIADAILALAATAEGYVLVPVERLQAIANGAHPTDVRQGMREDGTYGDIPRYMTAPELQAMIAACLPAAPTGETGA